jgi:hypothetical protein
MYEVKCLEVDYFGCTASKEAEQVVYVSWILLLTSTDLPEGRT